MIDSPFNRRIHLNTPMLITGPGKGQPLMQTTDDANPRAANLYGQIIRWREAGRRLLKPVS